MTALGWRRVRGWGGQVANRHIIELPEVDGNSKGERGSFLMKGDHCVAPAFFRKSRYISTKETQCGRGDSAQGALRDKGQAYDSV